jgi:hypothetical protein
VEPSGARKTVGCEINYGVRFDGQADADRFVDELAAQARARTCAPGERGGSMVARQRLLRTVRRGASPCGVAFLSTGMPAALQACVRCSLRLNAAAAQNVSWVLTSQQQALRI